MTPDPERAPGLRHRRRRRVRRIDLRSQLRLLQKPHVRHSREGGNLVSISGQDWIPAFAGMTRTGRSRVCATASASRPPPHSSHLSPRGGDAAACPCAGRGQRGRPRLWCQRAPGLRHSRSRARLPRGPSPLDPISQPPSDRPVPSGQRPMLPRSPRRRPAYRSLTAPCPGVRSVPSLRIDARRPLGPPGNEPR